MRGRISRRGFIGRGGLSLTGLLVGSSGLFPGCQPQPEPAASEEASAPEPASGPSSYGPFKAAFQSYSLRHFKPVDDFLRQAQKLNLSYVELWRGHLNPSTPLEQIAEVRQRLGQAGLQPIAFGVEQFTADHGKNKALFEFGKALGVMNLSANPTRDAFSSLEKLVQEYDIRIAIHNHGPEDEQWRRPEWILEAVRDLDPRIGACADLGHFLRADVDPVQAVQMLGSRVLGVHFKDFDAQGNDVVVGQGRLDVEASLRALKNNGFDGPLSLEFEGDEENPVPKMLECLAVIRAAVHKIGNN